jgi:hypothetical protein
MTLQAVDISIPYLADKLTMGPNLCYDLPCKRDDFCACIVVLRRRHVRPAAYQVYSAKIIPPSSSKFDIYFTLQVTDRVPSFVYIDAYVVFQSFAMDFYISRQRV